MILQPMLMNLETIVEAVTKNRVRINIQHKV